MSNILGDVHHNSEDDIQVLSKALCLTDLGPLNNVLRPTAAPPVTHFSQQQTWDCGLACVQMLVRWITNIRQGKCLLPIMSYFELEIVQQSWMREYVGSQSIWTMDLFALLHAIFDSNLLIPSKSYMPDFPLETDPLHFYSAVSVSMVLCSENLGVSDSDTYSACDYYRDNLEEDAARVRTLFDMAQNCRWSLFQITNPISLNMKTRNNLTISLDVPTLVQFISRPDVVAIALVDQSLWTPTSNRSTPNCTFYTHSTYIDYALTCSRINPSFTGHYVVLCGISFDVEHLKKCQVSQYPYCLLVRDPGRTDDEETCHHVYMCVSVEWFERCWRSTGTDSDVILISVQ